MQAPDPTRFILIGTSHPGNVGAAARAIKVMGRAAAPMLPAWLVLMRMKRVVGSGMKCAKTEG